MVFFVKLPIKENRRMIMVIIGRDKYHLIRRNAINKIVSFIALHAVARQDGLFSHYVTAHHVRCRSYSRKHSALALNHCVALPPARTPPVTGGAAAAWRSCAIPENSAASVDAVSRGASMSSPPLAVC